MTLLGVIVASGFVQTCLGVAQHGAIADSEDHIAMTGVMGIFCNHLGPNANHKKQT